MLGRLFLLFVVVPLVELALLVQLGRWVGFWPTIGLVVLTGAVGAAMARAQGLRTLAALRKELAEGRMPGGPLLDGLAILVGGAFLLTPGLLTDLAGFSLLLPPTRRLLQRGMRSWLERELRSGRVQLQVWTPFGGGPFGPSTPPGGEGSGDAPPEEGLDPRNEIRQDDRDRLGD